MALGSKFPNVRSIYLFGSVARGEADEASDVDLLLLVNDSTPIAIFDKIRSDKEFKWLEDWSLDWVEGGLNAILTTPTELVRVYDTLVDKILLEGTRLYGEDLAQATKHIPRIKPLSHTELFNLINSL